MAIFKRKNRKKRYKNGYGFSEKEKKEIALFLSLCKIIKQTSQKISTLNGELEQHCSNPEKAAEIRNKISKEIVILQDLRRKFNKQAAYVYFSLSKIK